MLNFPSFFNAQVGGYEIEQSLRFDGSSYLTRTSGSSGAKTFTLSFWSKKTGVANYNYPVFMGGSTTNNYGYISYNNGQYLTFGHRTGGNGDFNSIPNASYRDTGAWYHHVVVLDFSNATQGDRYRLYTNGVEVDSFSAQTLPSNTTTTTQFFRSGENIRIGCNSYNTSNIFDGYFAEFHCVYGSALDPDQFGEFDDNGVWRPIEYTGSHGAEGFYLKFDPSATNGIGHDHSGNGNNFSPTGFSTSGTGTDVMSDTPTTNWCTLNPLYNHRSRTEPVLSNGNLNASNNGGGDDQTHGTIGVNTGKFYFEYVVTTGAGSQNGFVGWQHNDPTINGGSGLSGQYRNNGTKYLFNNTATSTGVSWTNNDVIGCAVDADAGKIWFAKNNTWIQSGDPAAGSNATLTYTTTNEYIFPSIGFDNTATTVNGTANFGQRAFAYTPPTGYKALNTANLPAPTVKDGGDHFNTVLYTGNGSNGHAITGVGFQPDLVWGKCRNIGTDHYWVDAVRGVTKVLRSNVTNAEYTQTDSLVSFNSDGFTLDNDNSGGPSGNFNISGRTYAAWNWLAGGAGSSNTDGTLPSTTSANPSAGFSIATYTGNGTAGATVGHGLGVAPRMIIVKQRSGATDWQIGHTEIGWTKTLYFNTSAATTETGAWNDTAPTSTVFSIGTSRANTSSATYVAYCFSEVAGYSKFGSYTGNGSTDGVFVHCGFSPRWIMWKETTVGESWFIHDTARTPYNVSTQMLRPNYSNPEATGDSVDILSNGFKFRSGGAGGNFSGRIYIFAAFAEHPTGGSGVSPATAR